MKLHDDYEDHSGMTPTVVMTIVAVTAFVAVILIVVLIMNSGNKKPGQSAQETVSQETSPVILSPEPERYVSEGVLHPDDLDFWDKYPEEVEATPEPEQSLPQEEVKNDPATDGKHTLVEKSDGTEEWVLISPYLPKNEYDFTKLVCQSDFMKYYENGKQTSYVGVDVSKVQDYIDFVKVKKAGIQFVMIRVGARGYGTGQLIVDDYFSENIKRATDAGLDVGVYFYSQAISKDEAVEEANRRREELQRKRDAEAAKREAQRMREKYPGYEELLAEIKAKYEYASDAYLIRVPKDFAEITAEGMALHHCVGNTERYFDRIMSRETYICFLRQQSSPDEPFYTIEVEPGGTIRQHRGAYDEEPGIEEIKPFLREWQKVIRKRMSKEDHKYARTSAVLRQKNIDELKEKNNVRVLNGLMEDLMEVI